MFPPTCASCCLRLVNRMSERTWIILYVAFCVLLLAAVGVVASRSIARAEDQANACIDRGGVSLRGRCLDPEAFR